MLPGTVLVTFALLLGCLLAGWIGSIVAGFRSPHGNGLRGLLIFPISNPVALVILLVRDPAVAWVPLLLYGLAIVALPLGGFVSERIEKGRLENYIHALEQAGEKIAPASMIPASIPPEQNVWNHPFLEPLAQAGQPGPGGQAQLEAMDDRYAALALPQRPPYVFRYADEQRYGDNKSAGPTGRDALFLNPFRSFHEIALSTPGGLALLKDQRPPDSWETCGSLVVEYYQPAETHLASLEEALGRPRAQYPYAWTEGSNMLLPHLSKLKSFSQSTAWRSVAQNCQGQPGPAYHDLQTALRLIQIDDSNILISRLVQWAQAVITLNAVMVGQQYHAWTADQWAAIQTNLETLDLPGQVPDSIRAEQVFLAHATISPLLNQEFFQILDSVDRMGETPDEAEKARPEPPRTRQVLANVFLGGLARASVASQWRRTLEAYQEFIRASEAALQASLTTPWKDVRVADLPKPIREYGVFAGMFLPALENAFKKALNGQTQLRLAVVASALERYFLAQGRYPDSLAELSPTFLPDPPLDPMTRQPWFYERTGDRSFRLYSAGPNGIDEGGLYTRGGSFGKESRKDDLAWIVTEELPALPEIVLDPPPVQLKDGTQMPEELMRRYGLTPPQPAPAQTNAAKP
jgi:hypothetical protein